MFNEVKSSSAYWKLVKEATSSRVRKPIEPLRKCDDSLVLTEEEKAGLMNSFFANIGTNIAAKLPIPPGNATTGAYKSDLGDTSPLLLSQIEVSPRRICMQGEDIVPSMYRLFNTSIESESLYSSWKIVKLTPIFKKDDVTEIKITGQYRYSVLRAKS